MSNKHVSTEEIVKVIPGTGGVVGSISQRCGLSRSRLYQRIKEDKILRAAVSAERNEFLDLAEAKLFQAVKAGKAWAIRFTLSRLAKSRGYTLSNQVDASISTRVENPVRIYLPRNGREAPGTEFIEDPRDSNKAP